KFFFPSAKHTEALNSLLYAISERRGFVVITGEIGAGKTTVCRTLMNRLDMNTKVALVTNTHLTPRELIAQILEELEIEHKGGTKQKLLSHLNEYLIRQLSQDTNVVLIIDEAQNLTPKVLEEVRMLSNLETEKEKLIQIILLGQPQLRVKLENQRLEQFKQRIAVYYHLKELNKKESEEYILHRLKLVSSNGVMDIFEPHAIDLIYDYSKGTPRIINLICDSALLSGYVYDTKKISEKIILEVVKERDFNQVGESQDASLMQLGACSLQYKIYCCPGCNKYTACETKWTRGTKGQEQLCCPDCQDYNYCMNNIKKVKLN
ncbi:MAG: AAA family ATPase, partial [Candidatus Omnitrophica bacterium]|nr:AAA family ATPase [Candidatus Omnitrophota bacterium]